MLSIQPQNNLAYCAELEQHSGACKSNMVNVEMTLPPQIGGKASALHGHSCYFCFWAVFFVQVNANPLVPKLMAIL